MFREAVAEADVTGAMTEGGLGELTTPASVTESVAEVQEESVEAGGAGAAAALAAWWRAARCLLRSLSACPRWRGRRGGGGGKEGAEDGGEGSEWGAPGCPMVQLNPMVVKPPLVVRLREASPPTAQTDINSVTEAAKNCELVLADILATFTSV